MPGMLPNQFATGMMPMQPGFGGTFGTGFPPQPSAMAAPFGGPAFSSNLPLTGPGPSIESFQKDGFKIMGKDPIKPKNEEGQREFAELFNLADTKIKDRAHDKPKYDLTYNPVPVQPPPVQ